MNGTSTHPGRKQTVPERRVTPPAGPRSTEDIEQQEPEARDCVVCGDTTLAADGPTCGDPECERTIESPEAAEQQAEKEAERHREAMMNNQMERGI